MANISGTAGSDTLTGGSGADLIEGLGGNDTLRGGGGADILRGGPGADTLYGEVGDDRVEGGADDDQIEDRDGGADLLFGEDGNDFIIVSRGTYAPSATVTLDGGAGDDRLWYQGYNVANPVLRAGAGADVVQFWALNGTATVSLGTGSDTLQLNQLFGNDIGHATIVVSDFATGAAGDRLDWIGFLANGLRNWDQNTNPFKSGHLRLLQSGTDTLLQIDRDGGGTAYAFTTLIKFENVAATALTAFNLGGYAAGRIGYPGTEGADALNGTAADDLLLALGGDDRLDGLGGADRMEGGPGNDIFIVDNVGDRAIEQAGEGRDRVLSSVRFTLAANVEDLELTGFAAIAGTGNSAANTIKGNSAANLLRGLGGNDVLEGRGGADSLFGGSGKDVLVGGAGADGFYFDTAPNAVSNVDKILDFSGADDTIYLDRDIFTGIAADGPLAAAAFRLGTTAVDADDRVLYDQATGNIRYDPDGAGGAAAILFAQVTPGTTLTSADFVGCI